MPNLERLTARHLRLVPLDSDGRPVGEARIVTGTVSVTFDDSDDHQDMPGRFTFPFAGTVSYIVGTRLSRLGSNARAKGRTACQAVRASLLRRTRHRGPSRWTRGRR